MSEVTTQKRPALVTFASIMMFLLGGMLFVWSIEGFTDAAWLRDIRTGLLGDQILIWAIIDLILAVVAFFAGYSLWKGGKFGWWAASITAVVIVVRWVFYFPWVPIAALAVIVICIMIIYALTQHEDYFE